MKPYFSLLIVDEVKKRERNHFNGFFLRIYIAMATNEIIIEDIIKIGKYPGIFLNRSARRIC